ncbi:MAG: hypothetical protein RR056_04295 [Acetivibrio sp.]
MKKYTIQEFQELAEIGEKYQELEKSGKLLRLPHPLGSMVYRVVPNCKKCGKAEDMASCGNKLRNGCIKKVMPCVFTIDLVPEFGKTIFGTESEAVVTSVS